MGISVTGMEWGAQAEVLVPRHLDAIRTLTPQLFFMPEAAGIYLYLEPQAFCFPFLFCSDIHVSKSYSARAIAMQCWSGQDVYIKEPLLDGVVGEKCGMKDLVITYQGSISRD